jgi:hypothetical protein
VSGPARQLKGRAARLVRLMPAGSGSAARTPFVLLVVLLLGGGLITLLLLNSSLNEGSFKLSELKKQTTDLTDEEQALQRDVDDRSAPDALERRARELGMVPGGNPAFLSPDGTVRGDPQEAQPLPGPSVMGWFRPLTEPATEPAAEPSAERPAPRPRVAPPAISPSPPPSPTTPGR